MRKAFADGPVTFYCGFDPTAPSLHFGNLVQILTVRRLQHAGHRPLGLVGGATGLIGDPNGRPPSARSTTAEVVAAWVERIRAQIEPFLDFDGDQRRADGQQPRLDRAAVGDRLPARHRQALPGQQMIAKEAVAPG